MTLIDDTELLPCPFCGGKPHFCSDDSYGGCSIGCGLCDIGFSWGKDEPKAAVTKWNTRAADPQLAALQAERDDLAARIAAQDGVVESKRLKCLDCNLLYSDSRFHDLIIDDAAWDEIVPGNSGLLCPNCIIGRLVKAGLRNVSAKFTSGPLALDEAPKEPSDG